MYDMTDVCLSGVNERKRSLPRIIACPCALLLHRRTPVWSTLTYTPVQTGGTTPCHAPVINFHTPAGRCVAFVRITDNSSPLGRRGTMARDRSGADPKGVRERLIFQGNTWRNISACIWSAVSAKVDSVDSISRMSRRIFFYCQLRCRCSHSLQTFRHTSWLFSH